MNSVQHAVWLVHHLRYHRCIKKRNEWKNKTKTVELWSNGKFWRTYLPNSKVRWQIGCEFPVYYRQNPRVFAQSTFFYTKCVHELLNQNGSRRYKFTKDDVLLLLHFSNATSMNAISLRAFICVPSVVFDHVHELNDVLAFFVFLARLVCVFVLPAERRLAALAKDVGDVVHTREQYPLFRFSARYVHDRVEEIRFSLTALE